MSLHIQVQRVTNSFASSQSHSDWPSSKAARSAKSFCTREEHGHAFHSSLRSQGTRALVTAQGQRGEESGLALRAGVLATAQLHDFGQAANMF